MADFVKTCNLNERIKFTEAKNHKNEYGEVVKEQVEIFSCWASVRTQMLKDFLASVGTVLEGTLTFIIRYDQVSEVKNTMQVSWRDKTYNIVQITKGEYKRDFTTIVAKEVEL